MHKNSVKALQSTLQLRRLATLTDVIYALVIVLIFMLLEGPGESDWTWDSMAELVEANREAGPFVLIALAVTIVYWIQNNALSAFLKTTDFRHSAMAIAQIFFLLTFLFSMRAGIELGPSSGVRVLESGTVVLMGVASVLGWSHAIHHREMLHDEVEPEEAWRMSNRILAEPLTALVTIPLAFVGSIAWEIGWLSYPVFVYVLNRLRRPLLA